MDYSERLMRQAIRDLPDGVYSATTYIDGYLDDPDPARRDLPIVVTITVAGDELTVDLTGTAPQVPDKPINMPLEGTVDCAIWLTLALDPARQRGVRRHPAEQRPDAPDHNRRAEGLPGESRFSRAGDRAVLSRQPAR